MSDDYDLEEILHEFAAEPDHGSATLQRYLRAHPSMAEAIVDLSLELRLDRSSPPSSAPEDADWLEASWTAFEAATASLGELTPIVDPFASLPASRSREVRTRLGVTSGVMRGFRDRIVDVATVPDRFLRALAGELGATVDALHTFLAEPPKVSEVLSFKADDAPEAPVGKMSFEQLLVDARVPERDRERLLAEVG